MPTNTPDSLLPLEKYLAPIAEHRPIADEYFFPHGGCNTKPEYSFISAGSIPESREIFLGHRRMQNTWDITIF
jgi:hypothetical protein